IADAFGLPAARDEAGTTVASARR
ncbi:MAG: hypothetical protein QOG70_3045, partial [Solirubrobacteraceae bacterium]|nr:hypothetical protein [Solirubrobacteraceae bacterium]